VVDYASLGRDVAVSGGPPCQPFSLGGDYVGRDDARDMFPEGGRAIREVQLRAFGFESVKGLLRQNFRGYLRYIELQLIHPFEVREGDEPWESHLARLEQRHLTTHQPDGPMYDVRYHLLHAANYGVLRKRERVFIVGFRRGLDGLFCINRSVQQSSVGAGLTDGMSAPAKPKYRTTNWKDSITALKARGSLLIWLDDGSASIKRGRRPKYSEAKDLRPGAKARNAILAATRLLGRKIWKKWSGYHRRSLVETKMCCFKLLGKRVMARDVDRQVAELQVRAAIVNRFARLGTPTTVAVNMP